MKHSSCAAISLLAAILISPSSYLLAQDLEGTLEKISRTGEFLIGYRTDASTLSYENSEGQPSGYSVVEALDEGRNSSGTANHL